MYLTWLNHIYDINLNHPLSNIFQADDVMHIEPSSISTCPPPAAQWTTVLPCRSTARDTSQPFWTKWHLVGRLNGKINENCWEFTQKLTRNDQKHPNHHWKCIAIWTKNIPPTPKRQSLEVLLECIQGAIGPSLRLLPLEIQDQESSWPHPRNRELWHNRTRISSSSHWNTVVPCISYVYHILPRWFAKGGIGREGNCNLCSCKRLRAHAGAYCHVKGNCRIC